MISQKERLLNLFFQYGTLSNHDLRSLQPPIYQYPVRIKELREAGYDIKTEQDKQNKKTFLYRLLGVKPIQKTFTFGVENYAKN